MYYHITFNHIVLPILPLYSIYLQYKPRMINTKLIAIDLYKIFLSVESISSIKHLVILKPDIHQSTRAQIDHNSCQVVSSKLHRQ